jgi:hypothetical protein
MLVRRLAHHRSIWYSIFNRREAVLKCEQRTYVFLQATFHIVEYNNHGKSIRPIFKRHSGRTSPRGVADTNANDRVLVSCGRAFGRNRALSRSLRFFVYLRAWARIGNISADSGGAAIFEFRSASSNAASNPADTVTDRSRAAKANSSIAISQ